jgi:hypothetical protein
MRPAGRRSRLPEESKYSKQNDSACGGLASRPAPCTDSCSACRESKFFGSFLSVFVRVHEWAGVARVQRLVGFFFGQQLTLSHLCCLPSLSFFS